MSNVKIEIIPPKQEHRWPTSNTKLASCLLVYGFLISREQPYIHHAPASRPDRIRTSVWFDPRHPQGLTWHVPADYPDSIIKPERELTPQDFEVAWRYWDEHTSWLPRYEHSPEFLGPLRWMRLGLDARHWVIEKLIAPNRKIERKEHEYPVGYRPYKIPLTAETFILVACLVARKLTIYRFDSGMFEFDARDAEPLAKEFTEDGAGHPIQWMKKAIVQQDILLSDLKRETRTPSDGSGDNVASLWMRVGRNIALVPTNMPPRVKEPLTALLYTLN